MVSLLDGFKWSSRRSCIGMDHIMSGFAGYQEILSIRYPAGYLERISAPVKLDNMMEKLCITKSEEREDCMWSDPD